MIYRYRYRYITHQKKSNDYRYKLQVACNRYIVTLIATRYDLTLPMVHSTVNNQQISKIFEE